MQIKKQIGKIFKRILPTKLYRLIANGFIVVPKYYKEILNDTESFLTYSLEDSIEKDVMLMRKYAHIIDKGLHRSDVTPGHSKTYASLLEETLSRISNTTFKDDPTTKWATSKLSEYKKLQEAPENFQPLGLKGSSAPSLSYEQLTSIIKERRSCRSFKKEKVSIDVLERLKNIANWAPSSCNKQPVNIYYTNDPLLAKECLSCCAGGTGFSEYIPSFLVVTADCRGYVWPMEMYLPHIDASLATQNLLLAAHTLGLSGCILTWAQKSKEDDKTLRKILGIPPTMIIIFCIPIGYSSIIFETPLRKNNAL